MRIERATVTLREIGDANRAAVEALRVAADQEQYVASVAQSFVDAVTDPGACPWYRAVYSGDKPVGFVMISDNVPAERTEYLGPYYLWRLLVDQRWQRRGLGSAALDLVVDYVRTRPGARTLSTSVVDGPMCPRGFYLRYGFVETGRVFDDEEVLELTLSA